MSDADVLAAATKVADLVAPRAAEIEAARRLLPELVNAMVDNGLFKLCVPVQYGGREVDPLTLVEAIETVSIADGSAGWCLMIGATSGLAAGWLPATGADEVYSDPRVITGGVLAPRGNAAEARNGYQVEGRWPFASGCEHCSWLMVGVVVESGPQTRVAFVPASEITVTDTWNVAGLRGTGSHDIVVHGRFVPASRTFVPHDPPVDQSPLYRMPLYGLLAVGVAAVSLGIARAALESFVELAAGKVATGHSRPLAARPTVQADIAKATADLLGARAYLLDAVGHAWEAANAGVIDTDRRAELRLAATYATTVAARSTTTAYTLAGGTAVYVDHPLQRQFRDAHVATQHMIVGPATWELAGRALLRQEVNSAEL